MTKKLFKRYAFWMGFELTKRGGRRLDGRGDERMRWSGGGKGEKRGRRGQQVGRVV